MKRLNRWWWWWRRLKDLPRRRALTWTQLRTIGHLPLMKATIFVPLIGYLIIFNETIAEYLHLVWEKDATPPVPTNLLLVYFGLVCLSVGSVLYALFCDRRIDQYGSAEAYIGGDGPNISAVTLGFFENEVTGAGYDLQAWQEDGISPVGKVDSKKDILWCMYDKWDAAFPIARAVTTVFYIVGFVILLIPSLRVFWEVSSTLLYRIG
jgi:cytochrome b561